CYAHLPTSADMAQCRNECATVDCTIYIEVPWTIGEFASPLPKDLQASWVTAPLPGPDGPAASIAGGPSLVLFRGARNKIAAWQLIEYLSQPSIQRRFHELTGDLPPRRSAWAEGALANDVYARAFREQLERVKATPKV